jgi:creatinine amidohydrolase
MSNVYEEFEYTRKTYLDIEKSISNSAIFIIPTGATEQHGPHLPLQTDYHMAQAVAMRSAKLAKESGVEVLVTPPVWSGYSPHHMDFSGSITLRGETFTNLLIDIVSSIWKHGARKIFILNGHGGNMNLINSTLQILKFEHNISVAAASYWSFASKQIPLWRLSELGGIDHACEMEMSLMMHDSPGLTTPTLARNGSWFPKSRFLTGDLMVGAPVNLAWNLRDITPDGILGNPEIASAERGEVLMKLIVDEVSEFLVDFNKWDWSKPSEI